MGFVFTSIIQSLIMPTYSYECTNCGANFELFFYIKDYVCNPKCINCHTKNTCRRYVDDVLTQNCSVKKSDNELKTIGDLANRNRDRMSNDEKRALENKHNAYKDTSEVALPTGMTRMKKGSKTIWPT
jgi:putative FmdB family regulatory protein